MAIQVVDHDTSQSMIKLIDRAIKDTDKLWGITVIKRNYLRPVTKEALALSIRPALEGADEAHFFFLGNTSIYVAWSGKQKAIYLKLRQTVGAALVRPELSIDPSRIMAYHDLKTQVHEIRDSLKSLTPNQTTIIEESLFAHEDGSDQDEAQLAENEPITLKATPEQAKTFQEFRLQNASRKQLRLMVVEDEPFSQKLLCEILRGVRIYNNNESPLIEVTHSINEAWRIYLKKAPDIVFIDLNLTDGSGHALARAIKEFDPRSRIIIVTSSNYQEELEVARQNNVDFFIAKPYNKKQILDCITSYVDLMKSLG